MDIECTKQKEDLSTQPADMNTVLGIIGSPRAGCNTATLVDSVLAGTTEYGAVTERIVLSELSIGPCRACNACQRNGECAQKDDMNLLVPLLEKSDVWVLGTPIYWWGPSAQFKAFIDRWYGLNPRLFQGKKLVLAIPMGGGDPHYARHIVGMMKDICNYLGMELVESVIATGMTDRNSVRESKRLLEDARIAGLKAIRCVRK